MLAALLVAAALAPPHFVSKVDNPWFPLVPGTTFVYRGVEDGKASRDVVTVTHRTKLIDGVRCTVVSDLLYLDGRLKERTSDYYAQDTSGTVWYYGEATAELDRHGKVTSREGSWQTGVHGARAGVFMPAHPRVGESFRQEYLRGHAEDWFRVLVVGATTLLTKEWTPLEPGIVDHKSYKRGVGLVSERTVKGGTDHARLVSVKRP